MRIGTNHGSLSDRIMSRYGDTPMGMVESAMEFLRIARGESYNNIVLSMKASNPQVMVQAYRLLIQQMDAEFGECYPLHLGVTEAGDGEDGRVKSAAGIGTLLEDGIGDTVRVSLTEDPEFEIPVCRDLVKRYSGAENDATNMKRETAEVSEKSNVKSEISDDDSQSAIRSLQSTIPAIAKVPYDPFTYRRRETFVVDNMGGHNVPVVAADFSKIAEITPTHLESIGYKYDEATDKWAIGDAAADYIFTGMQQLTFALPGTLKVINFAGALANNTQVDTEKYLPIFDNVQSFASSTYTHAKTNFVMLDCFGDDNAFADLDAFGKGHTSDIWRTVVLCLSSTSKHAMPAVRRMFMELVNKRIDNPVVIVCDSNWQTADEHLIHYSTECGALLLDGFGDGICLGMTQKSYGLSANSYEQNTAGRNYTTNTSVEQFINSTAFSILQATRTRISKTEYISCPSCGRTLFDLQETTAKIRSRTNHLKGVKIAIMGCIVNGPGEMADADFGYVGSGVGKITLYKGKEVVKRNVDSNIAVDELINLLKENEAWVEA